MRRNRVEGVKEGGGRSWDKLRPNVMMMIAFTAALIGCRLMVRCEMIGRSRPKPTGRNQIKCDGSRRDVIIRNNYSPRPPPPVGDDHQSRCVCREFPVMSGANFQVNSPACVTCVCVCLCVVSNIHFHRIILPVMNLLLNSDCESG